MSKEKLDNLLNQIDLIVFEQNENEINEIVQLANDEEKPIGNVNTLEEQKEIDEIVQLANEEEI